MFPTHHSEHRDQIIKQTVKHRDQIVKQTVKHRDQIIKPAVLLALIGPDVMEAQF